MKHIWKVLVITLVLSLGVYIAERGKYQSQAFVTRNSYGEGTKTEEYRVSIPGVMEEEIFEFDIEEQEYTEEEIQKVFQRVMEKLDEVVPGENKGFNRIENNLNLVTELEGYPVQIQWNMDNYEVLTVEGKIKEDKTTKDGTLVKLQGTISYQDRQATYVRNMMVYTPTREGLDRLRYEIREAIVEREKSTRTKQGFSLPTWIDGKELEWSQKKENHWFYVVLIGVVSCVYLIYRERERVKQKEKQRTGELLRDYPDMISKFTMLLETGITVKSAWEKMVQHYELQKNQLGEKVVYEEMLRTYREMQGGVSETEAYDKFGKRCGNSLYLKFATMLVQNLRKGSKGISEILRMEAIQAFENRKSMAKRLGEEAGTRLLLPMFGMLAVVFIMVLVPAFLTMKL